MGTVCCHYCKSDRVGENVPEDMSNLLSEAENDRLVLREQLNAREEELRRSLQEGRKHQKDLKTKAGELEEERRMNKESIKKLENDWMVIVRERDEQLQKKQAEFQNLQDACNGLKAAASELEATIEKKGKELQKSEQRCERLQNDLTKTESSLKTTIVGLEAAMRHKEAELERSQETCQRLQQSLTDLKTEPAMEDRETPKRYLPETRNEPTTRERGKLTDCLGETKHDLVTAEEHMEALEKRLMPTQNDLQVNREDYDNLQRALLDAESKLLTRTEENRKLEKSISNAEKHLKVEREENRKLQESLTKIQCELKAIEKENRHLGDDKEILKTKLYCATHCASKTLAEIGADLESKKRELEELYLRENTIKAQLDLDPNADEDSIERKILELRVDAQMNARKLDEVKQELDQIKKHRSDLEKEVKLLAEIEGDLKSKKSELEELHLKETTIIKESLGLDPSADEDSIEKKILELQVSGQMKERKLDKLKQELDQVRKRKSDLEKEVMMLTLQKQMRELEVLRSTVPNERNPYEYPFTKMQSVLDIYIYQYCLLCRTDFLSSKAELCRTHFRPIVQGVWQCCHENARQAVAGGCISIPHLFVNVTETTVQLTDGKEILKSWYCKHSDQ